MEILNLDNIKESGKLYGGAAGQKLGIILNEEAWLIKFPQNIRNFKRVEDSYSTSPLSEYIGSHIYDILGLSVHETKLGIKDGKLVVVCKDFTPDNGKFYEYREIKNYYNKELEEKLEQNIAVTGGNGTVLSSLLIHLQHNPLLNANPEIENQLWKQVIIDGLINNNDRNSGNWGIIIENKEVKSAPVFDNAASFFNKSSDSKIQKQLQDEKIFKDVNLHLQTAFTNDEGHAIPLNNMLNYDIGPLKDAFIELIPKIYDSFSKIEDMIAEIPEKHGNISVMSEVRKEYYLEGMEVRYNEMLLPRYLDICKEKGMPPQAHYIESKEMNRER